MCAIGMIAPEIIRFYRLCRELHLRPVKKIEFKFDPFAAASNSLRDFLYQININRVRNTNDSCVVKTNVVNDRSPPEVKVFLANEKKLLFKTENLSPSDIVTEYLKFLKPIDVIKTNEGETKVLTGRKRRKKVIVPVLIE